MSLYKALALSEELHCFIVHAGAGLKIKAWHHDYELATLPAKGWMIDDTPTTVEFEAKLLGCDKIDVTPAGGKRGAIYSFEGMEAFTYMAEGTRVRVTIEPL
jgi:hypothetical protein